MPPPFTVSCYLCFRPHGGYCVSCWLQGPTQRSHKNVLEQFWLKRDPKPVVRLVLNYCQLREVPSQSGCCICSLEATLVQ